jgi:hypothetical protein
MDSCGIFISEEFFMKITRAKLRQLIAESLNEMSSPMNPMSLDSLKPMMDQNEYEIISNNIRIKDTYLGQLVMGLEEAWMPNRFYAKRGFPGIYWTKIAQPFVFQGYELKQEDVQNAKQAVLEDPSFFTPTGLGRAIAILEYLDKSSGGFTIIDKDVF